MKNLIIAVGVLAGLACSAFAEAFPDISLSELKAAVASKSATLLDANGSASYKAGHIPGAIDFFGSESDLAGKLPADKSTLIVAYCYNPQCPAYAQAAVAAQKLGYTNIKHFAPGIAGWKEAGEPVEKSN